MYNNPNLINRLLCCLNPHFKLPCNHYVCGCNLAIFSSIAQVENCLTGVTNTCKQLTCNNKKCLRSLNDENNTNETPSANTQ